MGADGYQHRLASAGRQAAWKHSPYADRTVSGHIEFRQTMVERAFSAGLVISAIGLALVRISPEPGAPLWASVSVAVVLVGLYLGRMLGLKVRAEGDELVVCNLWWTTRLNRSDIEGFRVGGIYRPPYKTVKVMRRSGRAVDVDVFLSSGLSPWGRCRRDIAVNQLYEWLDAGT